MKNTVATFIVSQQINIKQQILNWCNQFSVCCFFDNNNFQDNYNSYECVAAITSNTIFAKDIVDIGFDELQQIIINKKRWLFGHIGYDFKNELFQLESNHQNTINFPNAFLFEPEIVVTLIDDKLTVESEIVDCNEVYKNILNCNNVDENVVQNKFNIQPKISKEKYIETIKQLQHHIHIGDCYEINFCQEFFAENATINPLYTFNKLNKISPTPFAAFYKLNNNYLLCASPERFVKKVENKIISQPIKGTAKRNLLNAELDKQLINELKNSQKEKSENVMIVDLVRNDLSKICNAATVEVEELMEVYSFKQVHQMISTIVGNLKPNINFANVLQALFPMGSMTGAPKHKVMQLIEQYEQTKRNIYSGCVGYISPENDFDFNVVIRSIMYNAQEKYVSYQVGGAITHYSNAEQEYEECLLKAMAVSEALK